MAEARETRVFYKALADFAAIRKELRQVRTDLAKTKAAEKAFNSSSAKSYAQTTKAFKDSIKAQKAYSDSQNAVERNVRKKTEAIREEAVQLEKTRKANVRFVDSVGDVNTVTGEVVDNTEKAVAASSKWNAALDKARQFLSRNTSATRTNVAAQDALTRAKERQFDASENLRISELRLSELMKKSGQSAARIAAAELRVTRARRAVAASTQNVADAVKRLNSEGNKLPPIMRRVEAGGNRLYRGLQRFGNWRPRLTPPFVALIPIIGAVIAAINPLIAIMGSLGSVAIGLAGSIGSLSGAFLALPGILSGVVSGIAAVIASMGGVGNVFKTYSAMQKATNSAGGGSTGPTQAERADELADSERGLARAQRNVQKAQENLNKARERALENLIDLRVEVSRAGLDEDRAIANLRQAQEAYWNVMADPGSTMGDKLDAAVSIKEAEADLQDVRKTNIKNQKALNEAEKKGIKNSDEVIDAQESLVDAIEAQEDAQRSLNKVQTGGGAAGAAGATTAINEFNEALNKLSPSARKFVLAILAMEDQWNAFKLSMQEDFFSKFSGELHRLPSLLRNLSNFLRPAAGAMGEFVKNLMVMLDSPEWSRDLETIGEQNATVIGALGEAFLSLATALKDIVIAAAPFTEWMVTGFAKGSENLADFVANARETGSLAKWLEKVEERLQKWWTVIKNIGATLFNYSAAAEDFGSWVLDGLVDITDAWREASEAARDEDSPFRQYLEDVKPLLSEVRGLFGDFFSWLREEMMDPDNIQDAQDLVKLLRDDLGPAIGRLLDTLADTDIDESFVKALTSIIESLDTILENGGSQAFETFFDVVAGGFEWLADTVKKLPPDVLEAILKFIGFMAAVSFVGKFTGITAFFGGLLNLAGNAVVAGGFKKLGTFLKGLDKLKFASALTFVGKLLKVAGVAGAILSVLGGLIDVGFKTGDFIDDVNKGDAKGAQEGITDREKGILYTDNPLAPAGTPGANPIPVLDGILSGIDDIFGTNLAAEFQNFLDDTITNLVNWATVDLPNWWAGVVGWWEGTVVPGWNGFWASVGQTWTDFWTPITTWWDQNVSQPILQSWTTFQQALAYGISWINTYVITPFRTGWGILASWFNQTFVVPIQRAWTSLQTVFKNGWNWINSYVITPFKSGFNTLTTTIGTIVTNIGRKWNELRSKFKAPIQFAIDTVYNGGIRKFWNGIAKKFGWAQLPTIKMAEGGVLAKGQNRTSLKSGAPTPHGRYKSGGVLPGYTPGRDVHDFVSPTGGKLSLSGGEAIMRPEFTKMVGGKKGIDEINKKARKGQAFANGGVFNGGGGQAFAKGGVWEVAGDVWDQFSQLFSSPVKFITDGIKNLVNPLMRGIPGKGTDYTNMVSKIPSSVIGSLASVASEKTKRAKRKSPDISPNSKGMKWQSMWAAVHAAFPSARLNDALRPAGTRTSGGSLSYHSLGRAIDVNPSSSIFNWIKKNYPQSRELIYSPMGGQQLHNGQNKFWGEPVRSQHWDHVHWAMKNGGVIPGLYDNGGWLPSGGMAVNQTGKPEAVLDPTESRALKALLSGAGLSGRPATGASVATLASNAGTRIVDNSINIEKLVVQNPVPEKMSDSLPKSIRKIGYMNQARTGK